ncbi:uncharacterized protein N7511_000713 [Penicillium nucicola]|uniref:uncharacterized protein n=1 Tax=Penicillium nucicola TaxID=1850975 RepID=UPI002545A533|nr:uncharacterized protein N7511_000713 [Penicillium nucicola]KAJ5775702.1 hypothetical protein N7511_000713 [Penicillium nucicola]
MFLSFDAQPEESDPGLRNPKHAKRGDRLGRRQSMVRACNSCRRRKIRCTGEKPCESCRWYKTPELCCYPERRQSSSHSDRSPTSSNNYPVALRRLIPNTAPENNVDLPREKLLDLVTTGESQDVQYQESPTAAASIQTHNSALSMGEPTLESLHSMPEELLDEGQGPSRSDSMENISDDVNALSLTARQPASYLGISSTQAAMKVIAWLHPQFKTSISRVLPKYQNKKTMKSMPPIGIQSGIPPTEMELLDAYFTDFHPLAPLLDQKSFRATHLVGNRKDNRWLALLNIVLALGSIAAPGPDNHTHQAYFERSMNLLNLATLGTPTLEAVQTLGLIGGWYCHYTSQPNLGYSLMGVSLRMAVTLGIQREPYDGHLALDPVRAAYQEFKRRVWWSLCCLETWGHETLGRPCMDFFAPSITVSQPRLLDEENYLHILPLIENVEFVKIASKIQESLAGLPTLTHAETFDLDSQLLQWWNNLPPALRDYEPCSESLHTARTVMRWRLYNQRMLLYRPMLLTYAMRRVPFMSIREDERNAILKCREIAERSIQDISMATKLNQMIGWNGVWLLFQATMVPLVYLSTRSKNDDSVTTFESCKTQVETAMLTLDRLKPYGHTAERTLEVVSAILEVCLQGSEANAPERAAESLETQDISHLNDFDCYPPTSADRVWDWTVTSFENIPPESMWEYLSWGAQDMWPGVTDVGFDNPAMSFFQSSEGNV